MVARRSWLLANRRAEQTIAIVFQIRVGLACVASVSARVRREKLGREQKKKNEMTGEGEGKEGNACPQTPRFRKTAFAHERSF